MKIWLDDIRDPPDSSWTVCRDAISFMMAIQYPPEIELVSFDHDLGITTEYGREITGTYLANKLAYRCLDYGYMPKWEIHSANPCGRKSIESVMLSLEKTLNDHKQ